MNDDDTIVYRCTPPFAHIFLNGRFVCECGELDYSALVEVITGKTVAEVLA